MKLRSHPFTLREYDSTTALVVVMTWILVLRASLVLPEMVWELFLEGGIVYDLLGSTFLDVLGRILGGLIQGR